LKPQLRGAITQSTVIESTTEISSLEGTSPREAACTSAHRVPNTLIADYGRERKKGVFFLSLFVTPGSLLEIPLAVSWREAFPESVLQGSDNGRPILYLRLHGLQFVCRLVFIKVDRVSGIGYLPIPFSVT